MKAHGCLYALMAIVQIVIVLGIIVVAAWWLVVAVMRDLPL